MKHARCYGWGTFFCFGLETSFGFVDVGVGGQGAQLEEELSYRVDHVMLAGH